MLPTKHSSQPAHDDLKIEFLRSLDILISFDNTNLKTKLAELYPGEENESDVLILISHWEKMQESATVLSPFVAKMPLPMENHKDIQEFIKRIDLLSDFRNNTSFSSIGWLITSAQGFLNSVSKSYPKMIKEGKKF
jgi:hypothetical protein